MGTLKVGRVGLDVTMSDPAEWSEGRSSDSRETRISGFLKSSSLTYTKALRTELLEQQGQIVALAYSLDDSMDGFYILRDVTIDSIPVSFRGAGLFPYEVSLYRIGSEGATEFQSLITGTVRANEHGLAAGEVQPIHAPARNHKAYSVDAGTPVQNTVSTEDGNLNRYYDMDFSADPSWSVAPTDYYSAGAYINVTGRLRAGLDAPDDPEDFEIGNKLIKIVPSTTAGVSDGRFDISWWTGSSYVGPYSFEVYFEATRIPQFMLTSIITNTPEVCRFRVVRDAEDPSSIYRHELDIEVRRGCAWAEFHYAYSSGLGPSYIQVGLESGAETLTGITPTGATDAAAYQSTDSWLIGTSRTIVNVASSSRIRINNYVADYQRDFFIGYDLGASTPNDADDLCLQYHGPLYVQERPVRR